MKLTDMIVSAILKKGILYEARMVDMEIEIPMDQEGETEKPGKGIKVHLKADHMSIQIEKGETGA